MSIDRADIGIHFGPNMGPKTLQKRYAPLYNALGRHGLTTAIIRAGQFDYDEKSGSFPTYSTIREAGVVDHATPVSVSLLRDFSGAHERKGTPAVNHQGVWALTRDKQATRLAMTGSVPYGILLDPSRLDSEEARKSMPGQTAVIKPTHGRASKNVRVVELQDKESWDSAIQAIGPNEDVLVEEYIDTSQSNRLVPEAKGQPHTIRVIAMDSEPSVVVVRIGQRGERTVAGNDTETIRYFGPELLSDSELAIVKKAGEVAANAGNGHSYMGVDLLNGSDGRSYLGELNSRPEIIEPNMDEYWSKKLAEDSALHIKKAHKHLSSPQ